MNRPADPTGTVDTALAHTGRLIKSNPALAAEQSVEILKVAPNHPLALLFLGSARRLLGDGPGALAILDPLAASQANWAMAQYELGLVLADLEQPQAALAALRRAVALKPDMPDAWRAVGDHLTTIGDREGADAAYARHIKASTQDPKLLAAASALVDGKIARAEALLRPHLKQHPTDVAAIRMLAEVAARLGRNSDAEVLLERCLELAPSFHPARHQYAIVLQRQNKAAAALRELDQLEKIDPRNSSYRNLKAVVLVKIGDYQESIDIYADVLKAHPDQSKLWLMYGHALSTAGREQDGIAAYRQCIRLAPQFGEAYWSLANLKTFRFHDEEKQAMLRWLASDDLSPDDRLHFEFSMGKALEDDADFGTSFSHYSTGNRLRRAQLDYAGDEMSAFVRESMDLFSAEFFAARAGFGTLQPDPVFIVGLPRAGSTLIEQILASHPNVEGTMELPDILAMAGALAGRRKPSEPSKYPRELANLSAAACRELGEQYIRDTRIQRKTAKPLFIDKMPNNFLHIGLIRLVLPNAKIIDARRHPMACCFSTFKQHFAEGHRYSYSLDELGQYYREYVQLMEHFDRVTPGTIYRVIHEKLVEDTETQVRSLLDYCGLPFDGACLRFHENTRPVRTPSAQQVRRPINREGLEQWRHYAEWLEPLRTSLGNVVDAYPDAPLF
jgi:tetratricopeptide (TPR) repeat protein